MYKLSIILLMLVLTLASFAENKGTGKITGIILEKGNDNPG